MFISSVVEKKLPFFIVGANRSGTTLLRLMLNAHSHLAVPDELIYFRREMWGRTAESWHTSRLSEEEYRDFVQSFLEERVEVFSGLDLPKLYEDIVAYPERTIREPYRLSLEAWAKHHGKQRWGEKTPGNLFFADVILDMFPKARFINLIRDPRAVVHSSIKAGMLGLDPILNALNWRRYVVEGETFLRNRVPSAQLMTIKYEDLVSDPEYVLRRVCGFLKEDFEPQMLAFYERAEHFMVEDAASSYNRMARRPISKARAKAWKDEMESSTIAGIEHATQTARLRYGYPSTDAVLGAKGRLDLAVKWAYWRWQVWRHRYDPGYVLHHRMFAKRRNYADM